MPIKQKAKPKNIVTVCSQRSLHNWTAPLLPVYSIIDFLMYNSVVWFFTSVSCVCKDIKKILKKELVLDLLQYSIGCAIIFVHLDSALSQKRFVYTWMLALGIRRQITDRQKEVRRKTSPKKIKKIVRQKTKINKNV